MMQHKLQAIEHSVIQQSGEERLIINDLILNREALEIIAALIPQYHENIRHIQIKGNNIDSHGFQLIFTALGYCSHLKSIEAEWNNLGNSDNPSGFQALLYLTRKLHYLQFIDLKNNRISHILSPILCEIIQSDKQSIRVIDLRWNDLGQLGAKNIIKSLQFNKHLKFLGLEDNHISTGTLMEIESKLKGKNTALKSNSSGNINFPISGDQYQSMDNQLRGGQLRTKIDHQQKQSSLYVEKIEIEIQKVLQKIKYRGTQMNQSQAKYQSLEHEHLKIIEELRQAQRLVALQKQRVFGMERELNEEKSRMRAEKYKLNMSIQTVMEKYTQRNQRQLEELDLVMGQKLDRLNNFLKERLHEKRSNRQKLCQLKQDIMKLKLNKEQAWNKGPAAITLTVKSTWQEQLFALEQLVNKTKSTFQSESKKGDHISQQLKNIILRALKRQEKLQQQIFQHQNKIKKLHNQMALKNLDSELNMAKLKLRQSKQMDYESGLEMLRRYLKYIQSQNNISIEIENMKFQELKRAQQIGDDSIDVRIEDLERTLRAQQAQNKLIRNQYDKLLVLVESEAKKTIQSVLFD